MGILRRTRMAHECSYDFLIDEDGTVRISSMGFVKNDLERIAAELAERRHVALSPLFRPNESVPANKPG